MIIGQPMSEQEFKDWHVLPWLELRGYNILQQEATITGAGRVDIVAEKDNELWIFELKKDDCLEGIQRAIGQLCLYFTQTLSNYKKESHLVLALPYMFTNKLSPDTVTHLFDYFRIEVLFIPYQWVMRQSNCDPLPNQRFAYKWLKDKRVKTIPT